jgi:hypothetical protein
MINAKWEVLISIHPETKDFRLELSAFSSEHSAWFLAFMRISLKAEG